MTNVMKTVVGGLTGARCLIFAVFTIPMTAQPIVNITGLESEQVFLLPPTSQEFIQALSLDRDTSFDGLLQYSALLKNASGKAIIAYSVWWTLVDLNGKAAAPAGTSIFDFDNFPPQRIIPPQTSRVVSTMLPLGTQQLRSTASNLEQAREMLDGFQKQLSVTISLDAVLFDDGTAVGPDRQHQISLWKAYSDSRRDTYNEVAERGPAGFVGLLKENIAKASQITEVPTGPPDFIRFEVAAQRGFDAYEARYTLLRGAISDGIMRGINERGEKAEFQEAKTRALRQYVYVHRKEN